MKILSRAMVCVLLLSLFQSAHGATKDYPYTPVPFTNVTIQDAFWSPRLETNRKVTVWYDFQKCEETGRIANFARAGKLEEGGFQGIPFNDSDVVKVVEGASYTLRLQPDPKLDAYLDDLIAKIAAAQEDDGYLYSARTLGVNNGFTGPERWSNLRSNHELYNVGHMYEAAVAHYQATGKRTFLDVAIKNADLICRTFGPNPGQIVAVPGHEEIEIGLVKLYRATGDEKYLRQAKFFIDMRGRADKRQIWGTYCQDHKPLIEQEEAVGHAVRGGYLYAGVADVAALTGDKDYVAAIDRIWDDVIQRKLYLIGSVGQHGAGEGYAGAYTLTNVRAYNETCASIALALWNHRMFLLHGESKYIDVLERIIYNGFLSGVSLSGDRFFYPNPLACDMRFKFNHGSFERSPWFGCSCCPVNIVRFIPSILGYVYAQRENTAYVNLFVAGRGTIPLPSGSVELTQETAYPWDGHVAIHVKPQHAGEFAICVRIPGWAMGRPLPSDLYRYVNAEPIDYTLRVNGAPVAATMRDGYAVLKRNWKSGDVIELNLPMPIRRVVANDAVEDDRGRVAIERGPIVYCIEGADHDGHVLNVFLPDEAVLQPESRSKMLGGITVLKGQAAAAYRADDGSVATRPADLTMIPYYAWCHRGANEMAVWLPRSEELAQVPPPPTIASTSRVSASHCNDADTIDALNDLVEPKNSDDHSIPRHTWWSHRGTKEWVQYDFKRPTRVSGVDVYWFDDTGHGQCRVPLSWRLLAKKDGQWQPVPIRSDFGIAKDTFNRVDFEPRVTDGLRLDVQLKPEFSGGILEWRVR